MFRRKTYLLTLCAALLSFYSPAEASSEWEVIRSGERKWELLLSDIGKATRSVCLECFIVHDDESGRAVRDLLVRKAKEGVHVRMMLDNFGNALLHQSFLVPLKKAGAEVKLFTNTDRLSGLSGINSRDHRKITVIDSEIAYIGGMNLSDQYQYLWNDTDIRIVGPAVGELERLFYTAWNRHGQKAELEDDRPYEKEEHLEIFAGGPKQPVFTELYLKVLGEVEEYIYFQTPYFCPPKQLVAALKEATARQVDVRLLLPARCDYAFMYTANQSFYRELLEAGIRVFEYLPRFDHSKVFTCDDRLCWVSSVNFDNRSFCLSYEVGALLRDAGTAVAQKQWFLDLLEDAREISLEEVSSWSDGRRLKQKIIRILEPQL